VPLEVLVQRVAKPRVLELLPTAAACSQPELQRLERLPPSELQLVDEQLAVLLSLQTGTLLRCLQTRWMLASPAPAREGSGRANL
jgi:hypothetical protein